MTRLEMQTRALERVGENPAAPKFYTAAEARGALDRAQRLFALLTLCIETTGTLPVNGLSANPLTAFPRYLAPLRIRTAAGAKVRPATRQQLQALNPAWQAATGAAPQRYTARGWNSIAFFPAFTGNATVTYAGEPAALAADGSEPEIAAVHHPVLIDFAVADLRSKEGGAEFAKTLPHLERFVDAVLSEITHRRTLYTAASYDLLPHEWKRKELMQALAEVARAGQ